MRSSSAALAGSITRAKSLTGAISSGGSGCEVSAMARAASRTAPRPTPARFTAERRGRLASPGIDVPHQSLGEIQVGREQRLGIRRAEHA